MRKSIKQFFTSKEIEHAFKIFIIAVIVVSVFSLIAVNFINPVYVVAVDLLVLIILLLFKFPVFGLYLMIFIYPYVNWQFIWGDFNLPYVDLVAILLFLAVIIRLLFDLAENKKVQKLTLKKIFPGLMFAGLFILASALSLFNSQYFGAGLKYLFRPIVFFYLMFIVLPHYIIINKRIFKKALQVLLLVGIIVGTLGFLSVVVKQGPSWMAYRAVPFAFGDFNPLGGNHNAIAEVMVVCIPIAFVLFLQAKKIKKKGWFILAAFFMTIILLLTFSRSGWLALLVQLLILFFVKYRHKVDKYAIVAIILILILAPTLFYFTSGHQIDWVKTSDANRVLMTKIALYNFSEHPIIGNGLNSFQLLVGGTFVYSVEFGDPLESHGFVQKLLTESGLLGLITFLMLLGYIFYKYIGAYKNAASEHFQLIILCLIMMLSGIVIFELFSTSYYLATMWLPIGIGLAGVKLYGKSNV
ncbi:O-antigen ligase family protein [Candidatus Kuenenbacteria bacterium]|nr:O-antigen ligase family protein [Candidatus Kuenenbacteria bacterium]